MTRVFRFSFLAILTVALALVAANSAHAHHARVIVASPAYYTTPYVQPYYTTYYPQTVYVPHHGHVHARTVIAPAPVFAPQPVAPAYPVYYAQ